MSMKLTISILLSDRYNTIEKCLESIVPLLQQVPCELILTITGKDPKVRELAQQYTDHIINYKWIDDFADARNQGLKEAKGEWFLFLDDDEWFEDVTPLIQFFNSGEYQAYNGAIHRVRNYVDWKGKEYYESHSTRLAKIRSDLRFEGKVHEHYNSIFLPVKELDIFVHHYGYVQKKREIGSQKVSRNLPLLLDMVEKNPNNQGTLVQLVQEYANIQDLEKAELYCYKGLELNSQYRDVQNDGWLYWMLTKVVFSRHGVNQAIQIAADALKTGRLNEAGKMQLYGMLVTFYAVVKEYKNVIDSLEQYLFYYEQFYNNPVLRQEQTRGLVVVDEIMRMKETVCYQGIQAALFLEQAEKIVMYLKEFSWNTPKMLYSYYNSFSSLMNSISKEKRELFQECFLKVNSEDEFILLQQMLYAHRKKKKDEVFIYYHKLKNSKDTRVRLYLIWLAGTYEYKIQKIVQTMSMDEWQLLLIELLKLVEVEEYGTYCRVMKDLLGEESAYYRQLQFRFLEQDMLDRQMSGDELKKLLDYYTEQICDYYNIIYRKEMLKEEYRYLLHPEYAFSLYYQEAWKEGFDQITSLKKAKDAYPRMLVVIKRLMEHLLREYDRVHSSITPEFQQLGEQVKEQVRQMMQIGQYETALPIVSQLVQLMPNDLEVLRLKQNILLHM
ncbi:MAG TPA: glycosyltransferase [Candidatus Scybalomonas excrementigallinarum]|nr:glycosyltransferase [Candidatus Scybalomonas excrementigallinarum]